MGDDDDDEEDEHEEGDDDDEEDDEHEEGDDDDEAWRPAQKEKAWRPPQKGMFKLTFTPDVPRFIQFITLDPGRQMIGSFHPIAANLFGDAYSPGANQPTQSSESRAGAGAYQS